jgi:hypothetical protein
MGGRGGERWRVGCVMCVGDQEAGPGGTIRHEFGNLGRGVGNGMTKQDKVT